MPNNKTNSKSRMLSVEETNARLDKEFAQQNSKVKESPPKEGESKALNESLQTSSVLTDKAEEIVPDASSFGSDQRPLRDPPGTLLPDDSHETDERAKKFLAKFSSDSNKRNQNPSLLLDDLRELGMFGELSEDQSHITMPFEDARTPSSNDYENDRGHFE